MRRALDGLFAACLWLAALCLLAIAGLVGLQVAGRILDAVLKAAGSGQTGFVILSLAEIAGYLLIAASFLALSATLKSGAHIRVTLVLNALPAGARLAVEAGALAFAAAASAYGTWHLAAFAYTSFLYNELSPGLIPVPLVYPQAAMAFGAAVLTVAFLDELAITLTKGRPSFRAAEDAISLGQEG
jgi:TRAP-type C4-dicarboxylate transport system permease small subunit